MLGDEYREAVPSLEDLRMGIRGASRFPGLARICEAHWEREELPGGEIRYRGLGGGRGTGSRPVGQPGLEARGNRLCRGPREHDLPRVRPPRS